LGARARALALVAALIALSGCGTGTDERDARGAVDRFEAAIQARDGAGACEELSEETSSKLEGQQKKPCERAILSVELSPSRQVVDASVWVTGAQVQLDGDTIFLDETSQGWKIDAAGCEAKGESEPYDCELEG
jgi:hypothetical protein